MPEEISASEIKVNFVSLLAQAQKQVAIPSVQNVLGIVGNVVGIYPEAADNIHIDNVVREVAAMSGAPEKILRSSDEVDAMREQRAAQQQAMAQQGQMLQAAQPAKNMAAGDGSALDELINYRGGIA